MKSQSILRVKSTYDAGQYAEASRANAASLTAAIHDALMVGQAHHRTYDQDALKIIYFRTDEEDKTSRCADVKDAAKQICQEFKYVEGKSRPWRATIQFTMYKLEVQVSNAQLY